MSRLTDSGVRPRESQGWSWLRSVIGELIGPHFVITVIILIVWATAIAKPIAAIGDLSTTISKSPNKETVEAAKAVLADILTAATGVSALFTTVLGLVLGHYFGQRSGAALAKQEKIERQEVASEATDLGDESKKLNEETQAELKRVTEALEDALGHLPENVEIPPDSPLARYLEPPGE